jgi:Protein of unknown function (DUF2795)
MSPRRVSSKHGPRLDDQLKDEVEPLVHGRRDLPRPEEDAEREGIPEDDVDVDLEGVSTLPRDAVLARRELSRHLRRSVFPARRAALLEEAEENDAPGDVLELLQRLPKDIEYGTVHEVWEAVGGENEPIPHGRAERYEEHHQRP